MTDPAAVSEQTAVRPAMTATPTALLPLLPDYTVRFAILALTLAVVSVGFSAVDEVRLRYFDVQEQGNNFVLTWEADVESDVRLYEVQRRTARTNNQFVSAKELQAHGSGKQYLFKDDQVYKSAQDLVDYRLVAVFGSGSRQILASKSVNYTPTALRRTWGSIKAMF